LKRTLITILLFAAGGLLFLALSLNTEPPSPNDPGPPVDDAAPSLSSTDETDRDARPLPPSMEDQALVGPGVDPSEITPIPDLHVVDVTEKQADPVIGDDAPKETGNPYMLKARLSAWGAGVYDIHLSRYSEKVNELEPYLIQKKLPTPANPKNVVGGGYPLAAEAVTVNGKRLWLYHKRWKAEQVSESEARFSVTLASGDKASDDAAPVLRIVRTFRVVPEKHRYDVMLDQRIENLSGEWLKVSFDQYGTADMPLKPSYLGDKRTVTIGYLQPEYDPAKRHVFTAGFIRARQKILEDPEYATIWPTEDSVGLEMVWPAMSNRYFTTALYRQPVPDERRPSGLKLRHLEEVFPTVKRLRWKDQAGETWLMLRLVGRTRFMAPMGEDGDAIDIDLDVYTGPKDTRVLDEQPIYSVLNLGNLIVYDIGGMCTWCTFAWLGELLLNFLTAIHFVVRDWGVAIIIMVAFVRLILHFPVTKPSQVNMMKFSKQMQALQPEIEQLKKKYKDDQQKFNQEMMDLYRKRGVNPASMGMGCLPMFLQMPIWIALYAMLFFAVELRHQPAFYGVFQMISGDAWPFLADLSVQDNFIPLGTGFTLPLIGWTIDAINILPILMALVFFIQQKYTTAQATTAQSDQVKQQQMIMKFMVLLFPIFLYKAPSGLTLYILTSTAAGIIESKRVRAHVDELEKQGKLSGGQKKGCMPNVMAAAMKQAEQQQQKGLKRSKQPSKGGRKGRR